MSHRFSRDEGRGGVHTLQVATISPGGHAETCNGDVGSGNGSGISGSGSLGFGE